VREFVNKAVSEHAKAQRLAFDMLSPVLCGSGCVWMLGQTGCWVVQAQVQVQVLA
jgi:hypothetical protein